MATFLDDVSAHARALHDGDCECVSCEAHDDWLDDALTSALRAFCHWLDSLPRVRGKLTFALASLAVERGDEADLNSFEDLIDCHRR